MTTITPYILIPVLATCIAIIVVVWILHQFGVNIFKEDEVNE